MQNFLKSKLFKILFACTASLFGIMAFEISTNRPIFIKTVITAAVKPCTNAVITTHYSILNFFNSFFKNGIYKEENEILKQEVATLRKKVVEYNNIKNENIQLKQALHIKSSNKNFNVEVASFIGRDPNNFTSFTIDSGRNKGISTGDVVLTKNGLVGTITNVSSNQSMVTTTLGLDIQIPAIDADSENDEKGVVCGHAEFSKQGFCIMDHLSRSHSCKVGDIISTFGNSNYPENIVIGKIREIRNNKNGMSCFAIIEPAENVMCVKDVVVIKRRK